MFEDLDFINNFPYIYEWLKIPLGNNPFLIPPEVLSEVNPHFNYLSRKTINYTDTIFSLLYVKRTLLCRVALYLCLEKDRPKVRQSRLKLKSLLL